MIKICYALGFMVSKIILFLSGIFVKFLKKGALANVFIPSFCLVLEIKFIFLFLDLFFLLSYREFHRKLMKLSENAKNNFSCGFHCQLKKIILFLVVYFFNYHTLNPIKSIETLWKCLKCQKQLFLKINFYLIFNYGIKNPILSR